MKKALLAILVAGFVVLCGLPSLQLNSNKTLSSVTYSLADRYGDSLVNRVFADNILLTLAYLDNTVKQGQPVPWEKVKNIKTTVFTLKPGQTFAFHDAALDKYKGRIAMTTNAHFNSSEGFESDGWLVGDGVCHLASFMYVASKEAGLQIEAPTRHDFAKIADVPEQDGVAIYYSPADLAASTVQNLYITNNKDKTVAFIFTHDKDLLTIKVEAI